MILGQEQLRARDNMSGITDLQYIALILVTNQRPFNILLILMALLQFQIQLTLELAVMQKFNYTGALEK